MLLKAVMNKLGKQGRKEFSERGLASVEGATVVRISMTAPNQIICVCVNGGSDALYNLLGHVPPVKMVFSSNGSAETRVINDWFGRYQPDHSKTREGLLETLDLNRIGVLDEALLVFCQDGLLAYYPESSLQEVDQ